MLTAVSHLNSFIRLASSYKLFSSIPIMNINRIEDYKHFKSLDKLNITQLSYLPSLTVTTVDWKPTLLFAAIWRTVTLTCFWSWTTSGAIVTEAEHRHTITHSTAGWFLELQLNYRTIHIRNQLWITEWIQGISYLLGNLNRQGNEWSELNCKMNIRM